MQGRGLIHVEGPDARSFLQGLVSNDLDKLDAGSLLYACLLTPQGKFLHDFFIHAGDGFLLIDCEGGTRAQDLYSRLNKHRLRSKVALSVEDEHTVYALIGARPANALPDPRHADMGYRSFIKPDGMTEQPFAVWDRHRIALTVPDGSRDMEVEKSTLIECNIDKLNGIDWDKGCYMGQELTARMHYRGLAKKHLYALRFDGPPPAPFTDLVIGDRLIGEMRSGAGDTGLALLKDEAIGWLDGSDKIRLLG